ncbi:MAG: antibiotic biosynthesis monooxygenase [Leptolyngbyaceae bacterium]|nr:antibiotic biosynthesis monooxygenase [Leptolyngbyaceae bacterium]
MTGALDANPDPSVTVVVSRRVKPGREAEFEEFLASVSAACMKFEGALGINIFRPASADDPEYRIIFKFDRISNLRHWEQSEERQRWFAQAEALTQSPPQIQVLTGLETWFTLPGQATISPPPRYKMALVTWMAVFPLISLISLGLGSVLNSLPTVLRSLVVTGIAIPVMTYLLMPQMTRLFAGWLYAHLPQQVELPPDQVEDTPLVTLEKPLPLSHLQMPISELEDG